MRTVPVPHSSGKLASLDWFHSAMRRASSAWSSRYSATLASSTRHRAGDPTRMPRRRACSTSAMTSSTEDELQAKITASSGVDATWQSFHVVDDQVARLRQDVRKVHSHPLVPDSIPVAGFIYDVDTGLIEQVD